MGNATGLPSRPDHQPRQVVSHRTATAISATVVGVVAVLGFGGGLAEEPHFADESAYYSQSYFAAILAEGRRDDPAWLDYPAYDLPPLPKYLIGAALTAGGYRLPTPVDAWAWYDSTSRRFDPPGALTLARVPIAGLGVVGCLAAFGIGTLAFGRVGGLAAGLLLAADPLYRTHSRRAMSDVPCEALLLLGLFFALAAGGRIWAGRRGWPWAAVAGVAVGLSTLSKLSGVLGLIVVAAWAALALAMSSGESGRFRRAVLVSAALVFAAAAATFVVLDPYLTARPARAIPGPVGVIQRESLPERAVRMFRLRPEVAADQQRIFPHNALHNLPSRLATVAVQGFGRFGPLGTSRPDSTRWLDARQDWGAALWLPLVLASGVIAVRVGRSQARSGLAPAAWGVVVHFGLAVAAVSAYLPMAWDRYQLSIQAPAALLVGGLVAALVEKYRGGGTGPAGRRLPGGLDS